MKIVWNSFHGRYSDNPRALYERLRDRPDPDPEIEHVWLAQAGQLAGFPDDVVTVDIDGPGARRALESADLVVANTHVEVAWSKPEGATYLQTWHGTPLKRVHRDVLWAPDGLLDRLDLDVARWDLLLSPNPDSTRLLRHAFRYEGETLESGYPRNDVLVPPRHDERRDIVRKELGLDPDRPTVLYAPTWRDSEGYEPTTPVPLLLDLEEVGAALGGEIDLLVRAHNMVSGRWQLDELPWVHDVSHLPPDIADAYTVADVMITDYSSAMFDFAVTGRPLLFFVPDLELYADSMRGFYSDVWSQAPGPALRTTAEVVSALQDLDTVSSRHAAQYAAFRERYNGLEDGHAADRVLARLGLG